MDLDVSGLDHDETHPQPSQKGRSREIRFLCSVLSRNDRKWESLKQDIHKVYMSENNTLWQTMIRIQEEFGFKASPRKWKAKLKEWGFEKHLSEGDMKIVAAKMDKRKRETGKDTVVFHNGVQIPAEKIANFKRRKVVRESDPASPGASTPAPITYCTPRIDMDSLIEIDEIAELDGGVNNLRFSAHRSSSQVESVGFNVAESNNTTLRASQKEDEDRILLVIIGCVSDKLKSSLDTVTEKRNAAASEHEEEQERNLLSDLFTQPESVPIQETEDYKHAREFVSPGVSEADNPVIDEPNFMTDTPDTPSTKLPIEEENLSALSQAIDECFREGWGIDVTLSQLLSMLTYVQGLYPGKEQPPKWLLSYQEMEPLATLAKKFIESWELSAAVSLYKGVIVDTWVLLKDVVFPNSLRALEQLLVLAPEYLQHELAILQIVVAGYLKIQLAAKPSLEAASLKILGVIARLRSIYRTKLSPSSAAMDRVLGSLTLIINRDCLGRFPHVLRYELLFCALNLANCYSHGNEFEAADALFHLRSAIRTCQISDTDLSHLYQQILGAEQMFRQHQLRRRSSPYRPGVRRWSHTNPPPAFPGRASLSHEEAIRFEVGSLCRSLICKREVFSHLTVTNDAPHTLLLNRKESTNITILDSETDTGFTRNSTRSQQSGLGLGRARRAPLPKRKEGLKVIDLESETDTGFTTSSTRSYKYGVTMSDSDVPGIDLSKYLNQ